MAINERTLIVTFHPETGIACGSADSQMIELLSAGRLTRSSSLRCQMPMLAAGVFLNLLMILLRPIVNVLVRIFLGQTAYLSALTMSAG